MYRAEFCKMLITHMAEGGSFESFGAVANVGRASLFRWVEEHKEFFEAKQLGELKSLKFYEDVGRGLTTGTLRRVSEEEYQRDADGNVVFVDGKPIVASRKYASARGDGRVWGLLMKNRFRWVEPIKLTGKISGGMKDPTDMTDEELEKELQALRDAKGKRKNDR